MGQGGTRPISVIRVRDMPDDKGNSFVFNADIAQIFQAPEIANLPVAVISLAGVTKTGKSFFLTFLLRYAMARYVQKSNQPWLDDEAQMGGFEFSSSIKTSGILMWPTLFECTRKDGKKICILLIDTQGTYDGEGSATIWSTVFAMSVLMSSLQIYNVEEEITEDDLQSLELYTGFMGLVPDLFASKRPGQNLLFLVRDFKLRDAFSFDCGMEGGNRYLYEMILDDDIDETHKEVREHIQEAFDKVECCTLPYPGRQVVESTFTGKVKDINWDFKEHAAMAVEQILNVDKLVPKKVSGKIVTCRGLFEHFKQLVSAFNKLELPTVVSPLRALADEDHEAAMNAAVKMYVSKMEATGCTKRFIELSWLDKTSEESMDQAIKFFEDRRKVGQGEATTPMHRKKLHDILINKYDEYKMQNKAKLDSVYRELPLWSLGILCILQLLEEVKSYSITKWMKLMLVTRLFLWVFKFYRKRIFGDY